MNEESPPKRFREKINIHFPIHLSLFEEVGHILPENLTDLLLCRTGFFSLGLLCPTNVIKVIFCIFYRDIDCQITKCKNCSVIFMSKIVKGCQRLSQGNKDNTTGDIQKYLVKHLIQMTKAPMWQVLNQSIICLIFGDYIKCPCFVPILLPLRRQYFSSQLYLWW